MLAIRPARSTFNLLALGVAAAFVHACALAAPAEPVAAPSNAKTQRFDGTWDATIVCPNASNAALTTTQRLTVDIKDGTLTGGSGDEGQPGSLRLVGRIKPDGSAEIGARGRVMIEVTCHGEAGLRG